MTAGMRSDKLTNIYVFLGGQNQFMVVLLFFMYPVVNSMVLCARMW